MTGSLPALVLFIGAAGLPTQAQQAPAQESSEYLYYELIRYRDRVEADASQTSTAEVRVLLRTATAVAEFGQIGSPYLADYGDVQFEEVVIEKPDGRQLKVKDGIIEDVNPFGVTDRSLAADLRFKKLTIPGLEPGDRLFYRMVHRERPLSPGRVFGEMKLAPAVGDPVQIYELDLPRDAGIVVRLREGLEEAWEHVPGPPNRLIRRLRLVVAWPSPDQQEFTDAVMKAWTEPDVIYTNFESWAEVAKWWWELSRDHLGPDASVEKRAAELVASTATPREKIEALYAFVASKIRYVNVSFGLGRMQPRPAPDVLANRYGDCKDKHALLAALASSVGIDVRPVLINTVLPDLFDDVASPQQFDHLISVARLGPEPADWLWLDATNTFLMPGDVGPVLRDKRALLIEASGEARIVRTPTKPPFAPHTEVAVKGKLAADGALHAHVVWSIRSDAEVYVRSVWGVVSQEDQAQTIETGLARCWTGGKVTKVVASDPLDVANPFRIEFDVERPPPTGPGREDESLWVPLPSFGLYGPATDEVELAAQEFTAQAEIEIAEGLSAHAPLSLALERPFGRFESTYSVEGRTLKLVRTLSVSAQTLSGDDIAAYEAFRKAINKDYGQEFSILGGLTPATTISAESLHTEGLNAFKKRDYERAVELLREATDADAKVKNGFNDLGRALSAAGRDEEALEAFSRQIETDPFNESAYAWRAFTLERLYRWDEAEKDLLKQIEVAPFEAWSYEKLAKLRTAQGRLGEAADFYARAAAVQPDKAGRWVDLGWAHARNDQPQKARSALDRALSLDVPDWMKISAAGAYDLIGDPGAGAELAEDGLASVAKRLATLSADRIGEADLWGAEYLARAWYLIGAAALAKDDTARGERYLEAAWQLWFWPQAAWALGDLREKEGRLEDAAELWSMASSVPAAHWWLPADRQNRIEAACRQLGEAGAPVKEQGRLPAELSNLPPEAASLFSKPSCQSAAEQALMASRTVTLEGPVLADLTEEVLLLADKDGRVGRVRNLSKKEPETFDRQLEKLGPVRLDFTAPDEREFKAVRRAILTCSRSTGGCALILDVPGLPGLSSKSFAANAAKDFGSIEIVRLEPPGGSSLRRGERVKIEAVVRYDLKAVESGRVFLVVQDQAHRSHLDRQTGTAVGRGPGEVTLTGSIDVPEDATRVEVFVLLNGGPGTTGSAATAHYSVE